MREPRVETTDLKGVDEVVRDRVVRLFKFVGALYDQRNPVTRQMADHEWLLRLSDIPDHESIQLVNVARDEDEPEAGAADEVTLLRCARPTSTPPPSPPQALAGWLGRDWDDFRAAPQPLESQNDQQPGGETAVVRFEDDPARPAALETYKAVWEPWSHNEKISAAAGEVFERLYALHGTLQREGERYELVVADGILSWARPGGGVRHPLLTRVVRLAFDPQIPEFRIVEAGEPTEFYGSIFRSMNDVDGGAIGKLRTEADVLDPHPLSDTDVAGFLRSVATTLSSKGRYVGPAAPGPEREDPVIGRGPAFILRKRTVGVARAIEAVIEHLMRGGDISRALSNVVGVSAGDVADEGILAADRVPSASVTDANSDESILFTKDANPEQLDIARCLERDDCVLVQGPPGTGKTHTIANLLGHLLAQGKSVLVLSHTTKALKVLREKVVTELQPLCVSVLDSKEDDASLKSSIEGIVERIGNADAGRLDREVVRLDAARASLVAEVHRLQSAVLDARQDEQREIVIAGEGVRPIDAAKEVAAGAGQHDWIPPDIILGQPLPLSTAEFAELYRTNESVSRDDEKVLTAPLPDTVAMPNPADFASLCAERRDLGNTDRSYRSELWNAPPGAPAEALDAPLEAANEAVAVRRNLPTWTARLIEAGAVPAERRIWDDLLTEIDAVRGEALAAQSLVLTHTPKPAPDLGIDRAAEVYAVIANEVERTERPPTLLGLLMRPEWKTAVHGATVGAGAKPRLPEHFKALALFARVECRRAALRRRWAAQVEPIGGPASATLGDEPEVGAQRLAALISAALDWATRTWANAEARLASVGLAWAVLKAEADAAHPEKDNAGRIELIIDNVLPQVMSTERARRRWDCIDEECVRLRRLAATWPASEAVRPLRQAVDDFDDVAYRRAFEEVERLRTVTERLQRRSALLERLERAAPGWANEIAARAGIHGAALSPGDAIKAWRWRQFENELNRRDHVSMPDLMRSPRTCAPATPRDDYRPCGSQGVAGAGRSDHASATPGSARIRRSKAQDRSRDWQARRGIRARCARKDV